jgi:hypothetical protein
MQRAKPIARTAKTNEVVPRKYDSKERRLTGKIQVGNEISKTFTNMMMKWTRPFTLLSDDRSQPSHAWP